MRRGAVFAAPAFTESGAVLYIGLVALIARMSGHAYVLFPELAALGHDVIKRPAGAWAKAPVLLVVTPLLTAVFGTLVARHLPYGMIAVLLDVGFSVLLITALNSPIAPAISAGLLPLILGVHSWWYPPSLLIGTGLLAVIAALRSRFVLPGAAVVSAQRDRADDEVEEPPGQLGWLPFFLAFVLLAYLLSELTGWRLVLFPPLVVIGFEAFAHVEVCPWAARPVALVAACTLSAAAGVLCVILLGAGPLGAMCTVLAGVIVLRVLDLHVPPALAVGLLPFVMSRPSEQFVLAVVLGTALESAVFFAWRCAAHRAARAG